MEIYYADVRPLAQESVYLKKIGQVPKDRQHRIAGFRNMPDRLRELGAGLLLEYGLRLHGISLWHGCSSEDRAVSIPRDGLDAQGAACFCAGVSELARWGGTSCQGAAGFCAGVSEYVQRDGEGVPGVPCKAARRARGYEAARLLYGPQGKPYLMGDGMVRFNLSHAGDYVAAVFSEADAGIDIERIGRAGEGIARRFFLPEEYTFLEGFCGQEKNRVFTDLWTRKESYVKAVGRGLGMPLDGFSVLGEAGTGEGWQGGWQPVSLRPAAPGAEEARPACPAVSGREGAGEEAGRWFLRTFHVPEGYVISVCGQEEADVEPVRITL